MHHRAPGRCSPILLLLHGTAQRALPVVEGAAVPLMLAPEPGV